MTQVTKIEADPAQPLCLIRLKEVKRRTGLSTSTIYRWMKAGRFPQSQSLGGHIAVWSETEINQWVQRTLSSGEPSERMGRA